jgi:hypothetical protein
MNFRATYRDIQPAYHYDVTRIHAALHEWSLMPRFLMLRCMNGHLHIINIMTSQ